MKPLTNIPLKQYHYYPFGLTMNGISSSSVNTGSPNSKYKYNGKEEQRKEFIDGGGLEWLDYGARMYDNQIGKWSVIDNLAEKIFMSSPYVYGANNPIHYIDPDGNEIIVHYKEGEDSKTISLKSVDDVSKLKDINNDFVKSVFSTLE